jgi:hypothetical protein
VINISKLYSGEPAREKIRKLKLFKKEEEEYAK